MLELTLLLSCWPGCSIGQACILGWRDDQIGCQWPVLGARGAHVGCVDSNGGRRTVIRSLLGVLAAGRQLRSG
jgi:hypothetical protein